MGQALCASPCPDAPLSVAVGGDNKQNYIEMVDLSTNEESKYALFLEMFKKMEWDSNPRLLDIIRALKLIKKAR